MSLRRTSVLALAALLLGLGGGVSRASRTTVSAASAPLRTLTVVYAGVGGTVTSVPAGISCRPTCSGQFPDGTSVTLDTRADGGFFFQGWLGQDCFGISSCTVVLDQDRNETAEFGPEPAPAPPPPPPPAPPPPPPPFRPPCRVPTVVGLTLAPARKRISRSHCRVGTVRYKASSRKQKGHVLSEHPKPGRRLQGGARIALTLGSGRR